MILVVGGTGTVGGEVVRGLKAAGTPFRALVRDPARAGGIAGAEVVTGDLLRPETLPPALAGVEKVFLLTPLHLDQGRMKANLIDAAAAAGVRHIVLAGAIGAAPDSPVTLGRIHGESQERVKASGMAYTFLQPTFFMQNLLNFAESIRQQGAFYLPLEDSRVAWIDARDIAAVAVKALTEPGHEGKEYPLTGPEALTGDQLAATLSDVLGRAVAYVGVSMEDSKQGMIRAGLDEALADMVNELYALGPMGHLATVLDTVERVTGRPARTFRRFAEDYADAFKGG